MGSISAAYDADKDLTIVTATGTLTADELSHWGTNYYKGQITSLILWDVTQADLSLLEGDQLREIAETLTRVSEIRRGGKTAFVYDKPLEFGIGRMFQAYSEMEAVPFKVRAFKSFNEAKEWLGVQEDQAAIKIDNDRKIIQRTVTGELTGERSIKVVREVTLALNTHRGYNVLIDISQTDPRHDTMDLMAIASECSKLRAGFDNKIAIVNPDIEERAHFAQLFQACMEAQGFRFRPFLDHDAAMEWLSV